MEYWNNGFWKIGVVVYWQNCMVAKILFAKKLRNERLLYKIIIPIFHHSIIPYVRQKIKVSRNTFNFNML